MTGTKPSATTSRALLGCALLAGVHLLAVAVLTTQLLLVIAILTTRSWQFAVLGSLTVVPVSTLAYGLLAGTSADVAEGPRIVLTPQQQPELWALTLQLAGELDTAAPATMRLADTVNAYASERSKLLGLIGGPRTLDLGLPLLLGLTRDELRAVLCHELGHYAGRHTRLAAVSHRGSVALERTVRYLEVLETDQTSVKPPVRLLLKLTRAYNGAYLRQTLAVRRSQELEADAAAARIAGAHTFAQALRTVHALVPLWDEFTENRARPEGPSAPAAGKGGVGSPPPLMIPDGVFRDFADRLADLVGRPFADGRGTSAPDIVSKDGLGSHPPLAVRLAALCPDGDPDSAHRPTVSAGPPAAGLLRDLPELVDALQDAMRPVGGATPAQAGATVSMKPPRLSRAFLRFNVKTTLIGMFLILAASLFVHTVISPPRTDPPPFSPPPSAQNVWPEASLPPLTLPTFTLPPLPPPGRLTTLPLLPVK
ncbi:M48 family metallopeptidase [Streptomyces phaeoluteigriseus]|uniref:M48 family metallopeptidase n=1 Tax=Streptomyces phaeoluteigriseus TaxID=114686 RepID=A0ABY4ZAE8_9ACTN|nr:M48 family metallopeptidase [Streptomyces phaeoluteigriseus]USQ85665.1 M48 family metallopeptidase [Streptomyces phaeoluteigriseus]